MPQQPEFVMITAFEFRGHRGHYKENAGWLEVWIGGGEARAPIKDTPVDALAITLANEALQNAERQGLMSPSPTADRSDPSL